jgi:hypothetical protein
MSNKRARCAATADLKNQTATGKPPAPAGPATETSSMPSTPPVTEEKNRPETASSSGDAAPGKSEGLAADPVTADSDTHSLIDKLLTEGSTFEDAVETANQRRDPTKPDITLNAVRSYFQGNPQLQARRVRYLVKTSESLLEGLGDPESAEARLAKAAFLTGYLNLYKDVEPITPKEAEHARMERANLNLKHQLLVVQRDKARQALRYTEERIRFLVVTRKKMNEQIEMLQQDAKKQQAGEPLGPAMLQRIQQIYGLSCQPIPYGGLGDGAKA